MHPPHGDLRVGRLALLASSFFCEMPIHKTPLKEETIM
jgi:hypothetical protein